MNMCNNLVCMKKKKNKGYKGHTHTHTSYFAANNLLGEAGSIESARASYLPTPGSARSTYCVKKNKNLYRLHFSGTEESIP